MAIRTIMMPIRGDNKGNNVLRHAAVLARRSGAHVIALHCRPRAQDLLPFGVPIPAFLKEQIQQSGSQVADAEERALREEFSDLAADLGLGEGMRRSGEPSAEFREAQGRQIDVIKVHGRLADVILTPKPDRDRNLGANTLKAAIFATGRPVMMCPHRDAAPATLGEHVTIGWNGSLEAARAVAMSMPLITAARAVTILTSGEELHGAKATDLVTSLALHGVEARVETFKAGSSVGRALLEHTERLGADLLVMGAYHQSHERETLLGGNTQVVVDEATVPVVFVH